jgi:hypothetical protein
MSWLLAVLLTLCASRALPVARAGQSREACAIVWIARARARAEQRIAVRRACYRGVRRATVCQPAEPLVRSRLFSNSLYQRPPPPTLS